jgi:hypothetical protein
MNDAQLAAIVDMMESNGLLHFSHVLTGTHAVYVAFLSAARTR